MTSRERLTDAGYLQVARFSGERPAGRLPTPACELSVFRLQLNRDWHVAALGDPPAETLERRIRQVLSRGTPASLPEDILTALQRRRTEATRIGPWVEWHTRPRSEGDA